MKCTTILTILIIVLLTLNAFANAPKTGHSNTIPYAPGRLMVKFTKDAVNSSSFQFDVQRGVATTGLTSIDVLNEQYHATNIYKAHIEVQNKILDDQLGISRWFMIQFPESSDMERLAEEYKWEFDVADAHPDYIAQRMMVPNDPMYADQWGHHNEGQMLDYCWNCGGHDSGSPVGTTGFDGNVEAAWDILGGYGSSSVIIAILDSGVDIDHPDLNLMAGYDFGDNDSNPNDDSAEPGHGTACAGVSAAIANNNLGVAGVAGGSTVMPLKVADSNGSMMFSYIDNAIYHAADNGADIISMSLGAATSSVSSTDAALQYAYNAGCTILAATGNENASTISYPAINQYVIGVGAASPCGGRKRSSSSSSEVSSGISTDPNGYTCDGERWWGSNYGVSASQDGAGAVDIIAPTILPTCDIGGSGGYESGDYNMWFNGTSCATPFAAGVCALIKSQNPTWTPAQVRQQLVDTADDVINVESGAGWDVYSGYGMVNAGAALGGGGNPPDPQYCASKGNDSSYEWITQIEIGSFSNSSGAAGYTDFTGQTINANTGNTNVTLTPGFSGSAYNEYWKIWIDLNEDADFEDADELVFDAGSMSQTAVSGQMTIPSAFAGVTTRMRITMKYNGAPTSCETFSYGEVEDYTVSIAGGVPNVAPTAEANGPYSGVVGIAVTFSSAGSVDSDGSITGYSWNFGDGTTSTQANPTHTYAAVGSYTATLTVTDNDGATANDNATVTISEPANIAPTAEANGPYTGIEGQSVTFSSAGSADSDGSIASYSWNFGDGTTSTQANPTHTYAAPGSYTATLTVADDDGATANDNATVTIDPIPVGNYATLPYTTGFEGGLDQYWTTQSANSYGRIETTTANTPHSGSYHLTMDVTTNKNYCQNEAWLQLNLSGESQVDFSFWWKEFGDETHNQDGIYLSDDDGFTFVKVQDLNGQSYSNKTWTKFDLDLDALATSNGLSLTSTFIVKFQQYDNYMIATDGFAFDDISVTAGSVVSYITSETEDNGSIANANGLVGEGVDVSGNISNSSDDDWFYFDLTSTGNINVSVAIGGSADLDWYLYHESDTSSYLARGYTTSNPESGSHNATQTGRYYVRVEGYNGATSAYTLTITSGGAGFLNSGKEKNDQISTIPVQFELGQNFPNPFNPKTTVPYSIEQGSHVALKVYNMQGQMIKTLVDEYKPAGIYSIVWDGKDDSGNEVSTGTYIYNIVAGEITSTHKMILMK